jgi:serine/threonine protein kinase
VAIKKLYRTALKQKMLQNFKKEVEICSQIHHPNVVLFMGACTEQGQLSIVTELMPKGNLEEQLHNANNNFSLFSRLKMARDTALGMNWLHCSRPPIIHRDLKPSNLLIDANGTVKVCDFGLSTVKEVGDISQPAERVVPGTPLWMAPELMVGKGATDKTDVYGYGMVLWEIVTGEIPFPEMENFQVFKRAICVLGQRPPIPNDMLPGLKNLIERCWHKEPSQRPTFAEIISELDLIMIDTFIKDEDAAKFWKANFLEKDSVLWTDFANAIAKLFGFPHPYPHYNDIKFLCLKDLVAQKYIDKNMIDPPDMVTLERFGNILGYFGPLISNTSTSFLDKVHNYLKQKWFHGEMEKEQAEERLKEQPVGTFLVRLSSTKIGNFTITKVSRNGKVNHQRIDYQQNKGFGITVGTPNHGKKNVESECLVKLVGGVSDDLHLEKPCPGSRFEHLFDNQPAKPNPNSHIEGYVMDY